jgi:hypothetical protein
VVKEEKGTEEAAGFRRRTHAGWAMAKALAVALTSALPWPAMS